MGRGPGGLAVEHQTNNLVINDYEERISTTKFVDISSIYYFGHTNFLLRPFVGLPDQISPISCVPSSNTDSMVDVRASGREASHRYSECIYQISTVLYRWSRFRSWPVSLIDSRYTAFDVGTAGQGSLVLSLLLSPRVWRAWNSMPAVALAGPRRCPRNT